MTSVGDIEVLPLEPALHEERFAIGNSNTDQHGRTTMNNQGDKSTTSVTISRDSHITFQSYCRSIFLRNIDTLSLSTSFKSACICNVFTIVAMVIGILIVYYTSPKPAEKVCTFIVKSEARSSISTDSHPHAIAVADFNNDGLSDVAVVNSGTNNMGVFLRQNKNTFLEQMTYSTGSGSMPYAITVGDFNHDQRMDIVVANFGSNSISIFLGTSNGTFTVQRSFSTGASRPRWVAMGDFNNDTQLDIVVANYGTNNIGVLLGDGKGNFANQMTLSTGFDSIPCSVAVTNLNNDHMLDIVVANSGTNNVGVFFGTGNGTFGLQTTFSTGINSNPSSLAIGDVNNDTYMDIVVACSGSNNVGVLLNIRNGTFTMPKKYSTGENSSPRSITMGDFDNDNKLDIAIANYGTASIGLLFGYGNGIFVDQMTFFTSSASNPYSLVTGDFNNDSRLDITVVNYDYNYVDVILTYRNYSFLTQTTYSTGSQSLPSWVLVSDLNNDHRLDVVVANSGTNNIGILFGQGDGTIFSQMTYSTENGSLPISIAVGDFNSDHQLDIAVVNKGTNTVGIFLGYIDDTFSSQTTYTTGDNSQPYSLVTGDLNNDTKLDIVVANYGSNNIGVFLGKGDGTFSDQITYSTGNGSLSRSVTMGDFNNDNQVDIAVINYGTDNVGIFLNFGNGHLSNQTTYATAPGSGANSIAVGDLNNDGHQDIVITVYFNRGISIFLGNSDGTFINGATYSTGSDSRPMSVAIGDWNNDNQLDIVVASCDSNNIVVFAGNGDGTFINAEFYSTGNNSCPSSITLGDLNSDGLLDIIVADYSSSMIGILMGSTFMNGVRENTYSTGSAPHPRVLALGDFNNDIRMDITTVNYGLSNMGVFLGQTNGSFSLQTMFSTGALSFPTSVAVGDLNKDSQLDIITTNSGTDNIGIFYGNQNGSFGSSQLYSVGSGSVPQSVVVGDFNNDQKLDIVIANSATGSVLTLLKYDTGAFRTQASYLTGIDSTPQWVSIDDFNNDSYLDLVVSNSGTDNIGISLGLSDGTFSNQTTYSTGVGSSPWQNSVADLNNDSCLDIVVGNIYGDNIGVFFGLCNGKFSNQITYSTGTDSRPIAIALADLNNDSHLDIVVALHYFGEICIFYGSDNSTFSNVITYSTGTDSYPISIAIVDLNRDDQLDIIVANYDIGSIGLFYGSSNGSFSNMIAYSIGAQSYPTAIAVADLNKDDRLDIAIANSGTDNIGIFFGNINGTFSNQITLPTGTGSAPNALVIEDFNNDNQLDIAVVNYGTNSLGVLLGHINGTFFNQMMYSTGDNSQPIQLAVADFNNDSRLDVVVTNSGINNVIILLGYINEDFLSTPVYSTGSNSRPNSITVADVDRDTQLDIVVANSGTDNIMILYGSGYGTFVSQTTYSTGVGSQPCWVAVEDINKDGQLDIVVANTGTNTIGIFLGRANGTFSSQTTYSTGVGSQPYSVAILDFNNDTQLDIAVSNYGASNVGVFFGYGNGSFASQMIFATGFGSHPFALAVGDVNNDNLIDIIATNNGYGNIDIVMKTC